jgi:hypothetical protein
MLAALMRNATHLEPRPDPNQITSPKNILIGQPAVQKLIGVQFFCLQS